MHDQTEQVWHRDFRNAKRAIPPHWLVRCDDGFVGIHPDYRHRPQTELYHQLCVVGAARGWL